jgi:hypothetical protein
MCRFPWSPIDALIDLVLRCGLRDQIQTWPDLHLFTWRITTVIPKRRPGICPDVVQDVPDIGAVRNEGDDAHLPTTDGAQEREHLVDAGNQHRPQVVRWPRTVQVRAGGRGYQTRINETLREAMRGVQLADLVRNVIHEELHTS